MSNRTRDSATKNEIYLNSHIDFDDRLAVHALGTLLIFLEKNWSKFDLSDRADIHYVDLYKIPR